MESESIEAVPAFQLQRVDDIDSPADRQMGRGGGLVEGDRFRRCGAVAQLQPQVASIATEGLGPHHLDLAAEQQWLPVSDPKWREHLDLLVEARLEIGKRRRRLDRDRSGKGGAVETRGRVVLQALLELVKATGEHGQPRRHRVPAESMEQRSGVLQAVDQVKALDAPRGSAPF